MPNPKSSAIDAMNINKISIIALFFWSLSKKDKILFTLVNFI